MLYIGEKKKQVKNQLKSKKLTKQKYKDKIKTLKNEKRQNMLKDFKDIRDFARSAKNTSATKRDIYSKYLDKASTEIKNYRLKRGIKSAAKIGANAATIASIASGGGLVAVGAKNASKSVAKIAGKHLITNPNNLYYAGKTAAIGGGLIGAGVGIKAGSKVTGKVYDKAAMRPKKKRRAT